MNKVHGDSNILVQLFGSPSATTKRIYYTALVSLGLYILAPTINSIFQKLISGKPQDIPDGRLDRVTSGLENRANDCYVNSSPQSLAASDTLAQYLHDFIESLEEQSAESPIFPMHMALATLLKELREPVTVSRTLSAKHVKQVARFLHSANLRSTQQEDAHEFTQQVLDSLHEEYSHWPGREATPFPFSGRTGTQLVCLTCGRSSEMQEQPFTIYEAAAPQTYSAELSSILSQEQTEVIEGYKCLCCNVIRLLENERRLGPRANEPPIGREALEYLSEVRDTIHINSEIPAHFMEYIKQYSRGGCIPYSHSSQVHRRTVITDAPKILLIHLSRSMYNGGGSGSSVRNGCRITYELELAVEDAAQPWTYKLCALTKHTGTHYSGHYQAYRRKLDLVKVVGSEEVVNRSVPGYTKQPGSRHKRIRSVVQKPFWKISDSSVSEASAATVLGETKYVYMLYYEREGM